MGRVYHGFQLSQNGRKVVVASFVDTGSDRTLISRRVARRLGIRATGKESMVTAAGHRLLAASGKVRVVSELDGIDSLIKVLITDAPFKADPDETPPSADAAGSVTNFAHPIPPAKFVNIDMIVGLDFLQTHKVRLSFTK